MRGDGLTMGGAKVKLEISILPPIRADSSAGGPPEQNHTLNMERDERKNVLAVARRPTTFTISREAKSKVFSGSYGNISRTIWLKFGYVTPRRVLLWHV